MQEHRVEVAGEVRMSGAALQGHGRSDPGQTKTGNDRDPASAVARHPSAAMSATTTAAPQSANADAVARPMPLVAPVMNATRPEKS